MSVLAKALTVRDDFLRLIRTDSWVNAITGLGGSRDKTVQGRFCTSTLLTLQELSDLYHFADIPKRIVSAVIQDGTRQGLQIADEDLAKAWKSWQAMNKLRSAATWGRLYGGGMVILGTDGFMDQPLPEPLPQGGLRYLLVVDRRDMYVEDRYTDIGSEKFGEPQHYRISKSTEGGQLIGAVIHESRVIAFGGAETDDRVRQRNGGWDLSVLQAPYDVLRDVEGGWRSVMLLLQDLSQAVFKIKGLASMIAEGEKDTLMTRMELVDMARSVARAVIVDADMEEFEHKGAANLTGLDPLLTRLFTRLAAASDMPVTRLMGMSPAGLNATGESDTRSWYDRVQSYRDEDLGPAAARLLTVIAQHEGIGFEGDEPEFSWPSLWQMSPEEEASHDKTVAETDKIYLDAGVVFPEEVAQVRFREGPFAGVIDLDQRQEKLEEDLNADPEPAPGTPPQAPPAPGTPPPPPPGTPGPGEGVPGDPSPPE